MLLGVLITAYPAALVLDTWWHGTIGDLRSEASIAFAHVMDVVGGGLVGVFVVPVAIGAFLWWRRGWRVATFAVATFAISALLVQIAKRLFARERPEDLMVVSDFGSFPSGHTANAATIAVVFCLVFPRLVTAIVAAIWVVLMAFSRTVVSAHWITDTLGGALLGVSAGLLAGAALLPWAREPREIEGAPHPELPEDRSQV